MASTVPEARELVDNLRDLDGSLLIEWSGFSEDNQPTRRAESVWSLESSSLDKVMGATETMLRLDQENEERGKHDMLALACGNAPWGPLNCRPGKTDRVASVHHPVTTGELNSVEFSDSFRNQYYECMMQKQLTVRNWAPQLPQEDEATNHQLGPPSFGMAGNQFHFENLPPQNHPATGINPGAPPPGMQLDATGIGIHTKPSIFVVPLKPVNFTKIPVHFTIQVFNLPPKYSSVITPQMFEAVAETPSGRQLYCEIKKDNSVFWLETFLGCFMASEEVGLYTLRVRLHLPFTFLGDSPRAGLNSPPDICVASDIADILVSRNYYRESLKMPSTFFQMDFQAFENVPCEDIVISSPKAWGLVCDKRTNRLYFTERVGNRVSCVDPTNGQILFRFNQNKPESKLNRPTGICCDEYNRRIIVCDKEHHRICFFTMDGEYISSFGTVGRRNGMFNYPWDVDVNPIGTKIVVGDSRNKRIQLFDGSGKFLSKFSVHGKRALVEHNANFDYPRGVSFDADGQLIYVTDFNTPNVLRVPVDFGSSTRLVSEGSLARPQGIVVDHIGNFLVADSKNNCIRHFSGDGQSLCVIHSIGTNRLEYPVNLSLMQGGLLAVLDGRGGIHIF